MTKTQIEDMEYQLRRLESCADDQRVMTAEANLKKAKAAALVDRKDAIAELEARIEAARKARNMRLDQKSKRWPDDCPKWAVEVITAYYGGTTYRDKARIVMWDSEARLVWLHVPGHGFWSGRGEASYSKALYTLISAEGSQAHYTDREARTLRKLIGRVSKEQLTKILNEHK